MNFKEFLLNEHNFKRGDRVRVLYKPSERHGYNDGIKLDPKRYSISANPGGEDDPPYILTDRYPNNRSDRYENSFTGRVDTFTDKEIFIIPTGDYRPREVPLNQHGVFIIKLKDE